jgi:hypothetical protein
VRNGFPSPANASAAVDQHRFLKPLVGSPNLLEFAVRERRTLVVANWNVLNVESVRAIVRNQIHAKLGCRAASAAGPVDKRWIEKLALGLLIQLSTVAFGT